MGKINSAKSEQWRLIPEAEELAWVVLRAVNRTQAKGSMVRLVVPRSPEAAYELGLDFDEDRFLAAEEHLLGRGYVVPVDIGLTRSTYTTRPPGLGGSREDPS